MCGIAGIMTREGMVVSDKLLDMLDLIQHRGPDAAGIAYFSKGASMDVRVSYTGEGKKQEMLEVLGMLCAYTVKNEFTSGPKYGFIEADITPNAGVSLKDVHREINTREGLYVHSIGSDLSVYKDGGTVRRLRDVHKIHAWTATHGIGHVRMATESAEDINAAHPFVSPFFPELAMVHNGQFTNYFNLRRSLETKGAIFKTQNDSEVASHLIAWAMQENGGDLEAALNYALEELDGVFCIMAATENQMGIVKDKLGIKPLLLFEKDGATLLGSEQIEFTTLFPDVYAEELEPGEVRVWNL